MMLDGGYGEVANESLYLLLLGLTDEERKDFENELRKENEKAYLEFKEWEKELNTK
jgi:hypothetical protein